MNGVTVNRIKVFEHFTFYNIGFRENQKKISLHVKEMCVDFERRLIALRECYSHLLFDLFQVIARFWLEMVIYLRSP